jgi:hypothetical protein
MLKIVAFLLVGIGLFLGVGVPITIAVVFHIDLGRNRTVWEAIGAGTFLLGGAMPGIAVIVLASKLWKAGDPRNPKPDQTKGGYGKCTKNAAVDRLNVSPAAPAGDRGVRVQKRASHEMTVQIIQPSLPKLLAYGVAASVCGAGSAATLTSSLSQVFGFRWTPSLSWTIAVVALGLGIALTLVRMISAFVGKGPRLEIGPDGFEFRDWFGSRCRKWDDINGDFVVIRTGLIRMVAYRLTESCKESNRVKPSKMFRGNDEVIAGPFQVPMPKLAELLNQYRRIATTG